ncbi:glycosyltransferase family 9 protein [Desulforhabdus amnigena]|uniref:glycosyltransferase family 9 protein n=1 Tax=Desulforhabdus amnigena TaxID=40218 RepID=UPI0016974A8E|nr:glycosyltransferase family 9 protein [Desulforhabdus amnigena]NLJ27505.1 glycosyltransferase family 9 protein [Deltaproteobacteria bacterium]
MVASSPSDLPMPKSLKKKAAQRPPSPSEPRRLVILHQGALGDFLLAYPVLEGLCHCQPDVYMDFWSKKEHVELIGSRPWVHAVHSCHGPELVPFHHEELWQDARIPPFLQDAHTIFIFGQESNRILAERLSHRLTFPVQWIQSFPQAPEARSVSQFLKDQLVCRGWQVEDMRARIDPSADERSAALEFLASLGWKPRQKPIIIHPGSGGKKKIWPLRNWWSLLEWLRKKYDGPILLSLGPADDYLMDFAKAAQAFGIHLLKDLSLPRLSAFLAESRFYAGNDSGVSHLAAATGIPCVVLFGPTDPAVWAPQGPHVHVIRSHWEEAENLAWPSPPAPLEPSLKNLFQKLMV